MHNTPKTFKSLDLDDLNLDDFEPKKRTDNFHGAETASKPVRTKPVEKTKEHTTVFPSREPLSPRYQQLNMHIKTEVAERFKALAVRDHYTTWKYGQIIEYLLDHYDRTSK